MLKKVTKNILNKEEWKCFMTKKIVDQSMKNHTNIGKIFQFKMATQDLPYNRMDK